MSSWREELRDLGSSTANLGAKISESRHQAANQGQALLQQERPAITALQQVMKDKYVRQEVINHAMVQANPKARDALARQGIHFDGPLENVAAKAEADWAKRYSAAMEAVAPP
mmetsp:Transcript_18608/g.46450  ORF Transcript_18608/g.46450 Transcript_18608/m.46450 type:complete len:113 (+) Transcript_18608:131-469(+)|eukprot:CAMPEP_0178993322 /NCGR_PEP_ID=MMETSP0795-20121207/6640_1 /TAXON_ID=88552 /ORGANISM="Amoebophrya sp., Strain Ameob2" /LENGTH=112 /DNA_ID=CAMNT_0020685371 /DNA_START=121 /DNA_END=459 /DNA_ORIENTATION=-